MAAKPSAAPQPAARPTAGTSQPASDLRQTLRTYYYLTKPGIIYGNCLSALGGFLLASQGRLDWLLGAAALAGTALVIACGCVLNNYVDRRIDARMERTQKRALVSGAVSARQAFVFAAVLGLAGFGVLAAFTNPLTVYLGLAGLYCYLIAYGIAKRHGPAGTIVGSFAGSTPVTAGYTAVTGQLDTGALLLFLAMAYWQMPHFYAIAMFRLKDYRSAGVPVMPAVRGMRHTKLLILCYVAAYTLVVSLLTAFGYTSYAFLTVMVALGAAWFWRGLRLWRSGTDDTAWARRMFGFSLVVLLGFSVMLGVDSFLALPPK